MPFILEIETELMVYEALKVSDQYKDERKVIFSLSLDC